MQRLADHGPANLSPLICVLGAQDYEINGNTEVAESFTQPHKLRSATLQLGLDDK